MKQPRLYTYNGIIGSINALKVFVTAYTFLKLATPEDIEKYKKFNFTITKTE